MYAETTAFDRAIKSALIVCSVSLTWLRLSPVIEEGAINYARTFAVDLQQRTTPDDAREARLEVVGYFPLPPSAEWEFDSDEQWSEYRRALRENLAEDFRLIVATDERLCFRRNWLGQLEYLQVEVVSSEESLRVRCSYLQLRDVFW